MKKCASAGNTQWYALFVRYQNEFSISRILKEQQGIDSKVPARKVWKSARNGRDVKVTEKPLFHSYVFVKLDLSSKAWRKMYSIRGIFDFVRFSGSPATIPDEQLRSVETLCRAESPMHEIEHMKLRPQDRVEVTGGPLKGAIGSFVSSNMNRGNFVVNLDLFHRSLITEVDPILVKAC